MKTRKATLIYPGRAELAEGPVWHDNRLWWVDIRRGSLNAFDPETGLNVTRAFGMQIGCAVPTASGKWLLGGVDGVYQLDWDSGVTEPLAASPALTDNVRFNDGKCDPAGRLLAGTMRRSGEGKPGVLYAFEHGKTPRVLIEDVTISNGLGWSPDGDRFYYIDSPTRRVACFEYDLATGRLGPEHTLCVFDDRDAVPDGMAVDGEGHLWIAFFNGSKVVRVHGQTGEPMEQINLPSSKVTSCCFGGNNLDILFITTASIGADNACESFEIGGLYQVEAGISGPPVTLYQDLI